MLLFGVGKESLRFTCWLQLFMFCFVKSWFEQIMLLIRLRWDWFFSGSLWVFILAPPTEALGSRQLVWL